MKHTKEETKAFVAGWVSKHKTISEENAALKESLAELIKVVDENKHQLWLGDIEWAAIDRAKKLLNKQQNETM